MKAPATLTTAPAGTLTLHPGVLAVDNGRARHAVEYGRLAVPENRSRPGGSCIEISFARFPARTSQPGPPIVFLAGGPGASGVHVATRIPQFFEELASGSDVIALDQRGVGSSRPCLDSRAQWDLPLHEPTSRAAYVEHACRGAREIASFWGDRGVDLAGYTTAESADDLEDLRRALGVDQISLCGLSYGSHLGLAYLKRHPERAYRAVLGLVEGPDDTYKLPANTQLHLARLSDLAEADANVRAEVPNLLDLMNDVLAQLRQSPVSVPCCGEGDDVGQIGIGPLDLQLYVSGALGSIHMIRELPKIFLGLARGNYSTLAARVRQRRQAFLPSAMSLVMDSASGVSPERWRAIREQAPDAFLEDVFNLPFPHVAEPLGAPDLGPEYRAPVVSSVPTLFLSGSLDGRTPESNARSALASFSRGQHLLVEGASHAYFPEATIHARRFFAGEEVTTDRIEVPFAFEPLA